jgi:hypothetical protein
MEYIKQAYTKNGNLEKVSSNYKHIDTEAIYRSIESLGFNQIQTSVPKKANDFSRHITRFQRESLICGELKPQLIVDNSHDGSRALYIRFGIFRIYCANGLVAGTDMIQPIRLTHSGKKTITTEEIERFVIAAEKAYTEMYTKMVSVELSFEDIELFGALAHEIRYGDNVDEYATLFKLRIAKRQKDEGNNLWVIYNRAQECLMKGTKYRSKRITSDRKAIDFNNELSNLALKFAA